MIPTSTATARTGTTSSTQSTPVGTKAHDDRATERDLRRTRLCALFATLALWAMPAWTGSIAPNLKDALAHAEPDEFVPVVVMMEAFPSREQLLGEVRELNRRDRRLRIISTLDSLVKESQRPVRIVIG